MHQLRHGETQVAFLAGDEKRHRETQDDVVAAAALDFQHVSFARLTDGHRLRGRSVHERFVSCTPAKGSTSGAGSSLKEWTR